MECNTPDGIILSINQLSIEARQELSAKVHNTPEGRSAYIAFNYGMGQPDDDQPDDPQDGGDDSTGDGSDPGDSSGDGSGDSSGGDGSSGGDDTDDQSQNDPTDQTDQSGAGSDPDVADVDVSDQSADAEQNTSGQVDAGSTGVEGYVEPTLEVISGDDPTGPIENTGSPADVHVGSDPDSGGVSSDVDNENIANPNVSPTIQDQQAQGANVESGAVNAPVETGDVSPQVDAPILFEVSPDVLSLPADQAIAQVGEIYRETLENAMELVRQPDDLTDQVFQAWEAFTGYLEQLTDQAKASGEDITEQAIAQAGEMYQLTLSVVLDLTGAAPTAIQQVIAPTEAYGEFIQQLLRSVEVNSDLTDETIRFDADSEAGAESNQ